MHFSKSYRISLNFRGAARANNCLQWESCLFPRRFSRFLSGMRRTFYPAAFADRGWFAAIRGRFHARPSLCTASVGRVPAARAPVVGRNIITSCTVHIGKTFQPEIRRVYNWPGSRVSRAVHVLRMQNGTPNAEYR